MLVSVRRRPSGTTGHSTRPSLATRLRTIPCIALLLAGLAFLPAASRSDDLGGIYRGLGINRVRIEGLDSSTTSDLRDGLALTERRGFLKLGRVTYEPRLLEGDIARIQLFMARRGYPYAEVSSELVPLDDSQKINVILRIDPGPPVIIDSLEFVDVGQARLFTQDEEESLGIGPGSVFSDQVAERARLAILKYLLENGYARAEVSVAIEPLDATRVVVRFTGERGQQSRFGEVKVSGVHEGFSAVVNRAANIRHGEPFHPRTVRDATDDIRALRLFRKVDVSLVAADSNTLDFVCNLSERDHRSIEAGIGYMTDDGVLVTASWEHRNLFKAGRGFRILGSATQFRQLLESSVIFPALFRSPTTGTGSVAYERKVEPAYESTNISASLIGKRVSDFSKVSGVSWRRGE